MNTRYARVYVVSVCLSLSLCVFLSLSLSYTLTLTPSLPNQLQAKHRVRARKATFKEFKRELESIEEHWKEHTAASCSSVELDKEVATVREALQEKVRQVGEVLADLLG